LEVRKIRRAQGLAAERSVHGNVVGVRANGVQALAVEPQGDKFVVGRRRRNGQRDDRGFFRRRHDRVDREHGDGISGPGS